ncbi:hypothetical protein RBI13_15620 [Alcaligenaceae bacterium A4P071]|nr:hypothetical protein [Alcaligenaceae bacterium A4P071]
MPDVIPKKPLDAKQYSLSEQKKPEREVPAFCWAFGMTPLV